MTLSKSFEDTGAEEYWYGVCGQTTKKTGTWIKFMDIEDIQDIKFISWEKHVLDPAEYYDKWMIVDEP